MLRSAACLWLMVDISLYFHNRNTSVRLFIRLHLVSSRVYLLPWTRHRRLTPGRDAGWWIQVLRQLPWQLGQTIRPSGRSTTDDRALVLSRFSWASIHRWVKKRQKERKGALRGSSGIRFQIPTADSITYVSPRCLTCNQLHSRGDPPDDGWKRSLESLLWNGNHAPPSHAGGGRQQSSKGREPFRERVLFRERVESVNKGPFMLPMTRDAAQHLVSLDFKRLADETWITWTPAG